MIIKKQEFEVKGLHYVIRSAVKGDAKRLSGVRLQVDGETEHMDRIPGEAFIDEAGFERIIEADTDHPRNICLVAEAEGGIIGYSRCAGNDLKRFEHKVEFGVGVLKQYWGYGIGRNLLKASIAWADDNGITKIILSGVLETNEQAIRLYKSLGFEIEGLLKQDRILSDGKYYSTYMMARYIV
ncbi:GNAT family N-acetyltransferase [Paenibacillus sp. MMS20-IR301]|uniref:GNAT family N-acetyltransferase n=1 Tax=Paenibacillus sp. MMS20-IR301 TaxID=2895946 RepID=UPI0028E4587A|nr:GNAT family N-acetyltransferase [Paenibacillus sp. MMS20-IR301]WNS46334.1 GNAT family N-acetyltransferase [Paenibacillus sp. MMS20-IR301]